LLGVGLLVGVSFRIKENFRKGLILPVVGADKTLQATCWVVMSRTESTATPLSMSVQ
jgi:hypothetical protein